MILLARRQVEARLRDHVDDGPQLEMSYCNCDILYGAGGLEIWYPNGWMEYLDAGMLSRGRN